MNLIIICKDTPSIQYIINSLTPNTKYVIHNIYDSIDTLINKIKTKCDTNDIENVGYLSINNYSQYFYVSKSDKYILEDCVNKDNQLLSWETMCDFLSTIKNNYKIVNFDFLTCNIFNNPNWQYVINKLSTKLNINIRSSINITGIEGDWILESHGANLVGIYFLESINKYNHNLDNNYNLNFVTSNNDIYLAGYDENALVGNQNTIFKTCDINNVNVKDFAVGVDYSVILSNDNKLYSIGVNDFGQLGDGTIINKYSLVEMDKTTIGLQTIDKVISSGYSTYVLSNNNIYACGSNSYGQLGTISEYHLSVLSKINTNILNNESINKMDAGQNFFILLASNNKLYSCGINIFGQLGCGDFNNKSQLIEVNLSNLNNVYPIDIKCGDNYTIILANDYSIYSCGINQYGQLGIGNKINQNILIKMNLNNLTSLPQQISCGTIHTAILTSNNELYFCGHNGYGQFGNNQYLNDNLIPIKTNINIMPNKLSCGGYHTVIKTLDNKLYSTGSNFFGQLGINSNNNKTIFTEIESHNLDISNNTILYAKYDNTYLLSNILYSCGYNKYSNNINDDYLSFTSANLYNSVDKIKLLKYGKNFLVILTETNKIYTSGINNVGQLGIGTNIDSNILNLLNEINMTAFSQSFPIDIACGEEHFVVLTSDHKIYGCGKNNYGQLGQHLSVDKINILTRITDYNNIKQIACGSYSTVFLTINNDIYSLGLNNYGQFGSGNNNNSNVPISMIINNIVPEKIVCGGYHTIILTNNFKLYACGLNNYGQLGIDSNNNVNVPIEMNLNNYNPISLSCGYYHTIVVDNSGNIYACGLNNNGQLGINSYSNINTLTKINNPLFANKAIISAYANKNNTFVIDNNKNLYSCGDNQNGECGVNSSRNFYNNFGEISKPLELSNSPLIYAGAYNTYIRKENIIYGSGANTYNQLNNFDYLDSDTLINFDTTTLTNISYITAGNNCLFIINDSKLYICGKNNIGQLGNGTTQDVYEISYNNFQPFITNRPVKVFTFDEHTFVLTHNNKLYASGRNDFGQLGNSNNDAIYTFDEINLTFLNGDIPVNISCGKNHSVMITNDKKLYSCGSNYYGQLGLSNNINKNIFNIIDNSIFNGYTPEQISCGAYHTLILTSNFMVYGCGLNSNGQLGNNLSINSNLFISMNLQSIIPKNIYCGYDWSLIQSDNNMLYGCGRNSEGQLLDTSSNILLTLQHIPISLYENEVPLNIACGYCHYAVSTNFGNIYTAGSNDLGQTAFERNRNKKMFTICKRSRTNDNLVSNFIFSTKESLLGLLYIYKNIQTTIDTFALTINSLIQFIDLNALINIGIKLKDLYKQNIPLVFFIENGVTLRQLYDDGFTLQEIYSTGVFNYFDILAAKFTDDELKEFKLISYAKDLSNNQPYEYYIIIPNIESVIKNEVLHINRNPNGENIINTQSLPFLSVKLFREDVNTDSFEQIKTSAINIKLTDFKNIFYYKFRIYSIGFYILNLIQSKYLKNVILDKLVEIYENKNQTSFGLIPFDKQILFYKELTDMTFLKINKQIKLTKTQLDSIIQTQTGDKYCLLAECIFYSTTLEVGFKLLFDFIICTD